ncbi:exchange protein directly activated by cAMP isoform X3 [Rhodnius prolixus]|uniref:exchange protein directly activated by cAMP isoform X3 n=1 Tax=Rhodnius prolixus TaxID=13249 RepID=UPI003D18DA5B
MIYAGVVEMFNRRRTYHVHKKERSLVSLCTLGVGSSFGESVLQELPRETTVLTRTSCELLRLSQHDLKTLAEKNKDIMTELMSNCKMKNGLAGVARPQSPSPAQHQGKRTLSPDQSNPAEPITEIASVSMVQAGWVLRTLLLNEPEPILRERKTAGGRLVVPCCASGSEMVTWLVELAHGHGIDRHQATTMWQALLEEGILYSVTGDHPFKDKCILYQFRQDRDSGCPAQRPPPQDIAESEEHLREALSELTARGPDAWLRMILRKPTNDRTLEELETVFEELKHMKPLSHLSNSMKRELASVIMFEAHPRAGTVVFEQGEEGRSWYLVLCGSVDVVIHGKGTVATLHMGEDFGKLALINDVPRAASIIVREDNTHLLRVDKEDFNRILRDVEANTVRLKEHGKDVLVLEKSSSTNSPYKYVVMACTAPRMIEHLLESRLDTSANDPALDDFFLTHVIFISTRHLVQELRKHYNLETPHHRDKEYSETHKRRVASFVYRWVTTIRHPIFSDPHAVPFIEELTADAEQGGWEEATLMHRINAQMARHHEISAVANKWKLPPGGQPICLFSPSETGSKLIKPKDDIIFRVYCADHTYCTLRLLINATAEQVKVCAADKLGIKSRPEDLVLVEVKSNGERVTLRDAEVSVPTGLTLNGKIFVAPKDHLDALTVIPEQEQPTEGMELDLEDVSAREMAYHMTMLDWELFWNIHEYELLYHTFGRHRFGQSAANLDTFLRRFNELQYWVVTEICLTNSLSKRVQVLRKMIKLAAYCKEYHNINGMFALVLGLSNVAVSRLSLTWDKLPSKSRKLYTQLEATIDPSRNHRAYRAVVSSMDSPLIPFMPLLLKDMTFIHEGNKTTVDGLVNFEKMHMLAQTLRTLRYCRNRQLVLDPPTPKNEGEVKEYVRCLRTIDNQRTLNSLSQKLEPRRS